MKNQRLSPSKEKHALNATLYCYTQQHLQPIIEASPFLSTQTNWTLEEPFETLLVSTFQKISGNYPKLTYQQLQQKIEAGQLAPAERQPLENGLQAINQKLVADNKKLNRDKKIWYRNDLKAYLKHPFKRKKPDKSRYKSLSFTASDSPYTLDHAYNILALTFQALAEEQARLDFRYNTDQLEADKERDRQDQAIHQKTEQLAQVHHETNDRTYDLLAKEQQLKRELERLKHLTNIARGYTLSEDQDNLTSPAEQIEALEKLLKQKRRG